MFVLDWLHLNNQEHVLQHTDSQLKIMQATHLTLMPLVVEHTIYSVVNVLRPAVQTNQNNFVQLLCNQFSCCMHCNLPMPVPSHSITTVTCTSCAGTNSTACTTVVFTFNAILCDNTLHTSCTRIATHQFF